QKGRYRQFHQFGAEVFGFDGPDIEAELILLGRRIWQELGVLDAVELQINSIGTPTARNAYREKLIEYFSAHLDVLDEDSKRRLHSNPMRILDSKVPATQQIVAEAPVLLDFLDDESRVHFETLQDTLSACGVAFKVNLRLVRGLDYYSKTVFEWVTDKLGSQGAICAGGRYDALVEHLGGRATPACGFAIGSDRVVALMDACNNVPPAPSPHAYLIMVGEGTERAGMALAERLRSSIPELALSVNCGAGSFKAQMKRADKSNARWALLIGESELESGLIAVKPLRGEGEQQTLKETELTSFLHAHMEK
ncbi:MAG: histidine--tRNA ligase, partial [Gammaproteobacteria bacterium]|nr:histidine--tRNA ligase [Gammaproteobacteria bacterium]